MDWVVLFHFFFRGKEIDNDVVMMKWEHEGVFYFLEGINYNMNIL